MYDLVKQMLNSNLNYEDIAKLLSDLIECIENEESDNIQEILDVIHNNVNNDVYVEFYNEYMEEDNVCYFIQQLEDTLYTIFVEQINVCPKCGHRLNESIIKEKYEYMGSKLTNDEMYCTYCSNCGWKEY